MDVLKDLLECSWRGIPFPTQNINVTGSHDLARHKRMDRDGETLEATGRNSYVFDITAPLLNNLFRGKNQTWNNLFPDTFSKLLKACEERATGDFVHPIFGTIKCKASSWSAPITADTRDGVYFSFQLIETTEDDEVAANLLSSITIANNEAINLDNYIANIIPPITRKLPNNYTSFEDMINSITKVVDQAELIQAQINGKIDSAIASVNKVASKIDTATQFTTTNNPITGLQERGKQLGNAASRIFESTVKLNDALFNIKTSLPLIGQEIGFYEVPASITVSSLAKRLKNKASEIIKLNPQLAGKPVARSREVIKYYKKSPVVVSTL